jgi:Mg2+-importing ATPase
MQANTNKSDLRLLLRQFTSPIILILLFATVLSMALGEIVDGIIILCIIIPSGLLGYFQEHRAGKTMQALLQRVEVQVNVIRAGQSLRIAASSVQIDDEIILTTGSIISGDAITIQSNGLLVDESLLTGESFAIEKSEHDLLLAGTHVVGGSGRARVTKIGGQTQLGSIEKKLAGKDVVTSFEKGTIAFGQLLMKAMLGLVIGVLAFNLILHRPLLDSILFSLALAVGLTPQLLPVIISASLSTGARAMAKKKVLVKRLDAIEDFGVIDVLCTDKTGTITSGAITLTSAIDIAGNESSELRRLAFLNAKLQEGFPNPIDQAIINSASSKSEIVSKIGEVPYDFTRRRLSVVVDDNGATIITKGAFESILAISNKANEAELRAEFERLSAQGNRVLALATKKVEKKALYTAEDENQVEIQGLLAFMDPPKEGVIQSIELIRKLNIEIYLVTGDNKLAAHAIGAKVGIPADHIFAEVNPLEKEAIIKKLQAQGKNVAYFGDGINDAPALKAADVGISVDTAVDVAKNAASVVLLDKDLDVLAAGVVLGRKTFVNTMKYVRVGISAAFGNVLSMAVAALFLPYLPMLPLQILLLNFLTDFPAIMIAGDEVDPEILDKPRAWDVKKIKRLMIIFGLISTLFDLATFALLRFGYNADEKLFHSAWFVESALTELVVMMVLRTHRRFWRSKPGKGLFISSLIVAAIIISLPFTALGATFGFVALPLTLILWLLLFIAIYIVINEGFKNRFWN